MTFTQTRSMRVAHRAQMLVVGALAVVGAACGTTDAAGPLVPNGEEGRVRFVNLITDTTRGRVNAILEGVPFGVNVTFTGTTPFSLPAPSNGTYSPILAGSRSLVLKRTADTNTVVATLSLAITANQDRTVYVMGGAAGSAITSYSTVDDNVLPAVSTQTRVRVVHLSPTAGPVDIFVTAPGADLAAATPTLANVPFQAASPYLSVAAGTYQVRVVPAGTAPASRAGSVAINVASLVLPANTVRTIVAADNNIGGAPLRAFMLTDR